MADVEPTLSRRGFALLSGAAMALPAAAFAPAALAVPLPKIPNMIAAYDRARSEHERLAIVIDRLERTIEDDPAIRLHFYNCEAEISHFSPEERERIRRGDAWSVASGHDALVKQLSAAVDEMDQREIELLTHNPETLQDLADLLTWHAGHSASLPGVTRIEQADAISPRILAEAAQRLAGRAA